MEKWTLLRSSMWDFSSLLSDLLQMIFFGLILIILLVVILPKSDFKAIDYVSSSIWNLNNGVDFIFVALLQIFSYPFHDTVLTDRGFISSPKVTLKSFIVATVIGFGCILLFSSIGVFAKLNGLQNNAIVEVSKMLGVVPLLLLNLIMITSAASTIDSTFSSFSKLAVKNVFLIKNKTVFKGRLIMILVAVAGTLPVFFNPEILSATTVSGTMVMGLAPVFLFWNIKAPKLSFHLPIWFGIGVGIIIALDLYPKGLLFSTGKYNSLLSANFLGLIICFILYFIPILILRWKKK